jgi:2-deoxy-D-gluconate 3-dehydrogenase
MDDPLKLFDLTGRAAVVTGGAGLLGNEFCRTLMAAGARVVVADIDGEKAVSVADSLNKDVGGFSNDTNQSDKQAIAVETDVTSKDSVQLLVKSTLDEYARLDILVNSAALDPKVEPAGDQTVESQRAKEDKPDPLEEAFEAFPLESWNHALDINLTGMFLCCQAAGKQMLKQISGVIINLCSIYGLVGPDQRIYQMPDETTKFKPAYYSVTKAGVLGLTKYLATYYAGKGIRVNALTPGGIYNDQDDSFVKGYSDRTLVGRMAEKDEMNGALLFLASDASSYMTGANLIVDGGWTAW